MDAASSPTNGTAAVGPTPTTASSPTAAVISSSSGNSNSGFHPALLSIIIPFSVVILASIVGAIAYVLLRRRRRRRKASPGDAEQGARSVVVVGGPGDAILGSTRIFAGRPAPPHEEGLNELGEAPPPYVPSDGGARAKRTRRAPEESTREVSGSEDGEEDQEGEEGGESGEGGDVVEEQAALPSDGREGGGGTGSTAELPPPTYDAVVDEVARLSMMTPTAVCGMSSPAANA